jgi:hypothetical protein
MKQGIIQPRPVSQTSLESYYMHAVHETFLDNIEYH